MKKSILITDKVHPKLTRELEKDGFVVNNHPKMTLSETIAIIQKYDGVIVNSKTICNKKLIDKAENLKFIGRLGSGLEIINLKYAAIKGIHVLRTPEANCGAVAEQALGMILCLFNNIKNANAQLKTLNWQREENRGIEIRGKTIGIIGYGYTGTAFHELIKPFGAKIIVYDKYKAPYQDKILLDQIHNEADIISIHLPLTNETIGYVNSDFIKKCKKPFYIINTARGKNVVISDLIEALDKWQILGACLDVFENENSSTFTQQEMKMYLDLYNRVNVICTPHIAGWTEESLLRIAESMLWKIRKLEI
ncbi:MAG: NAD(P)-dependent oxidoreductase [Saprospiraceae bacterium]